MKFGVIISGFGYFAMASRSDVHAPSLQEALAATRGLTHCVVCACRDHEGLQIPMETVRCEEANRRRYYRIDRRRVADPHHPTCIFLRTSDGLEACDAAPTESIFDVSDHDSPVGVSGEDWGVETMRWTSFIRYARKAWSSGYTKAWASENASARSNVDLRNPSARSIASAIVTLFEGTKLAEGQNGYLTARRLGLELQVGIAEWDLRLWLQGAPKVERSVPLHAWAFQDDYLSSCRFWASTSLLAELADSVRLFKSLIAPPYLYTAVLEPGNRIRKVAITPVFWDDHEFAFSDSTAERSLFRLLLDRGRVYYRGLDTLRDYEQQVPRRQQIGPLPENTHWPCLPDALVYGPRRNWVIECRGFGSNREAFRDYHAHFDQKCRLLMELLRGTNAELREVDAASLSSRDWTQPSSVQRADRIARQYPRLTSPYSLVNFKSDLT